MVYCMAYANEDGGNVGVKVMCQGRVEAAWTSV